MLQLSDEYIDEVTNSIIRDMDMADIAMASNQPLTEAMLKRGNEIRTAVRAYGQTAKELTAKGLTPSGVVLGGSLYFEGFIEVIKEGQRHNGKTPEGAN